MKKKVFIILLSTLSLNSLFAQSNELDVLKKNAASAKTAESYMDVADYYFTNYLSKDEIFHAYHDSAYKAAIKEGAEEVLGRYFYRKAWLYNSQNLDSLAILSRYLLESLVHFEAAKKYYRHTQAYMKLGTSFYHSSKIDSALYFLHKSIEDKYMKESSAPYYDVHKNMYFFINNIYTLNGNMDSVLKYTHKILDLAEKNNDTWTVAEHTMFLGDRYSEIGEHNKSIDLYLKAGKIFLELGDYSYSSHCFKLVGEEFSHYFNRQDEAINFYEEAIGLAQKGENKNLEADCLLMMGVAYKRKGEYDKAISFYRQSAALYDSIGEKEQSNKVRYSIMLAFKDSGQVDSARAYLHKIDPYDYKLPYDTNYYNTPIGNQELQTRLDYANIVASMNTEKFDLLSAQYYEKEAATLRLQILLISVSALLIIIALLLIYARQRQKIKAEKLKQYAEEKEHEYALLQSETEMRLIRKYIDGLENERERLSKELHDGVCNDLLALEMKLKNTSGNRQELEKHLDFLNKTRENIRHVSYELMPPAFQYANIDEMLSDYISHIDKPEKINIKYSSDENTDWSSIPDKVAYETYRIAQEALSNSIRHSSAGLIEVSLTKKDENFNIVIKDNGKGFNKNNTGRGIGIRTMLERVKSLDGELVIDTGENGTLIEVKFKL
jgi:signal transduction histidine kinase